MDGATGMIGSFWWWTIVQICQMEAFWLQEGAMLSHGAFGMCPRLSGLRWWNLYLLEPLALVGNKRVVCSNL